MHEETVELTGLESQKGRDIQEQFSTFPACGPVSRVAGFAPFVGHHDLELQSLFLTPGVAFTLPDGTRTELRHIMEI